MHNERYNPAIWADMNLNERSIYYIAEAYEEFAKSRKDFRKHLSSVESKTLPHPDSGERPADKIRNHKNWQYFEKVWDRFIYDQSFDAFIFMDAVAKHLPKDRQIYPAQLATKKNFEYYLDYRESIKLNTSETDDTKRIMEGIVQSYKLISKKVGVKNLSNQDIYNFFNKPKESMILSEGLLFCMQQMISPYYFSVSKSFISAYNNSDKDIQDEILPLSRLKDMHNLTKVKPKIYEFLKKIFDEDIA
jgi:hypothetical protein